MKRVLSLIVAMSLIISMTACGSTGTSGDSPYEKTTQASEPVKMKSCHMDGCYYEVPEDWEESENDAGTKMYKTDKGLLLVASFENPGLSVDKKEGRDAIYESVVSGIGEYTFIRETDTVVGKDIDAYMREYKAEKDDTSMYLKYVLFDKYDMLTSIVMVIDLNKTDDTGYYDDEFESVLNSVTIKEPKKEKKEEKKDDISSDGIISFKTDTFSVKYDRFELSTDYDGNKVLLYFYDFENLSNDTVMPSTEVDLTAFQNGVQCDIGILLDAPDEYGNGLKSIQPGAKVKCCSAFVLTDDSDVTIEGKKLIDFSDNKDTQIISVK